MSAQVLRVTEAEIERAAELHTAETERAHRKPGVMVFWVALMIAIPLVTRVPAVQRLSHVTPFAATAMVGIGFVAIACAMAIFYVKGPHARVFKIASLVESAGVQVSVMGLVYASRRGDSVFWFIYFAHIFNMASVPLTRGYGTYHQVLFATGPAVLAAAFAFVRHDLGDAGLAIGAGLLGTAMFLTQHRGARRVFALLVEREALLREAADLRVREEQARIARDLHDGLGATLVAMSWHAQALTAQAGESQLSGELAQIASRAVRSVEEMRSVVWATREPVRAWEDVVAYVSGRAGELAAGKAELDFEAQADDTRAPMSGELAMTLLRIVQESVRNAIGHGAAARVRVRLTRDGSEIRVHVEDDGRGFAVEEKLGARHGGLANLRVRAEQLGGAVVVASTASGSSIDVRLPAVPVPSTKSGESPP